MKWYNPKDAERCLPEGEYDAVIDEVEAHQSKSGNLGRKVKLTIYSGETTMTMFDYLMAGPEIAWKIQVFAKALGQSAQFDSGDFDPIDFKGHNIRVSLKIQRDEEYGDQNKIKKYLPPTAGAKPPPARSAPSKAPVSKTQTNHPPMGEEDIPF